MEAEGYVMNDTKTRLQQAEIDRMFVKRFKTLLRDAIELSVKAAGFAIDRIVTESPIMENIVIEPRSSIIPILVICFSRYGEVAVPIKFEGQSFKDIADYVREFLEESGMGDETDSSPDEIVNAVTRHVAHLKNPHSTWYRPLRPAVEAISTGTGMDNDGCKGEVTPVIIFRGCGSPWRPITAALRDTTYVVWCPAEEEPMTTAWYDGEAWSYWKDGPKLRSDPSHCMRPEAPTGV